MPLNNARGGQTAERMQEVRAARKRPPQVVQRLSVAAEDRFSSTSDMGGGDSGSTSAASIPPGSHEQQGQSSVDLLQKFSSELSEIALLHEGSPIASMQRMCRNTLGISQHGTKASLLARLRKWASDVRDGREPQRKNGPIVAAKNLPAPESPDDSISDTSPTVTDPPRKPLPPGLHEAYAAAEDGGNAGDAVFQHPYVRGLLKKARARVGQAFAEQPGPEADRWLVCVRTYSRAKPDQPSELMPVLRNMKLTPAKIEGLDLKLKSVGIDTIEKLKLAVKKPDLSETLKRSEHGSVKRPTLEKLKLAVQTEPKKPKPRERGLLQLTLAALNEALGPDAARRCLIFVSHEDPDVVSGRYEQALQGTPWQDRVVQGVKGAQLQVRFIEEAAPMGSHVVVMDDNIEHIVIESREMRPWPGYKGGQWITPLCHNGSFDNGLEGTGLEIFEESETQRFLRAAFPKLRMKSAAKTLQVLDNALKRLAISTPAKLLEALDKERSPYVSPLKKALVSMDAEDAALIKRFVCRQPSQDLLRRQAAQPLPTRRLLVRNRLEPAKAARSKKAAKAEPALSELIKRAGQEMVLHGANLWSINPSKNHYFMHSKVDDMRKSANKCGIWEDVNTKLGLAYGAFFGFRVLRDPRRYTRHGQIKDDVERSLRYWHCDGKILRMFRYAVVKLHKPGKFIAAKGGISAGSSSNDHEAKGVRALKAMLEEFAWRYARLPKPGEKGPDYGVVWTADDDGSDGEAAPKRKGAKRDRCDAEEDSGTEVVKRCRAAGA